MDLLKSLSEATAAGLTGRTGKRLAFPLNSLEASTPVEDPIKKSSDELKNLPTSRLDYKIPTKKPTATSSKDNWIGGSIEGLKKLLISKSGVLLASTASPLYEAEVAAV